jgi:CheY-like chemotaxis protein
MGRCGPAGPPQLISRCETAFRAAKRTNEPEPCEQMVGSRCCMSPSSIADLKIVLVEDHDDARRYLDLFLGQLGAKVIAAKNAFEGLEAIKNSRPDLVLSDIKMPGMDGFELLDKIRELGLDAGGSVPVIAMSAFFSQTDRERAHHVDFRACQISSPMKSSARLWLKSSISCASRLRHDELLSLPGKWLFLAS